MPSVCSFYGIVIYIHYDEHNPPHFHAIYQGKKACFEIESAEVLAGKLPPRAVSLI